MTSLTNPQPSPLDTEAGQWLLRLQDTQPDPEDPYFDPAVRDTAFLDWLSLSPQHIQVFLEMFETYQRLGNIDPQALINIRDLLGNRDADVIRIYGTPVRAPKSARKRRRLIRYKPFGLAAAAVFGALIVAGVLFTNMLGARTYTTEIGEQSTVRLEDGSMVYLNTDSEVKVRFSRQIRDIRLIRGEALFVVEHNSHRPFIVSSSNATVRAVGTRFDVRQRAGATDVSVVEGVVQVTATDSAGVSGSPPPAELVSGERGAKVVAGEEAKVTQGKVTTRACGRGPVVARAAVDLPGRLARRSGRRIQSL